jgi:hypothetical protein
VVCRVRTARVISFAVSRKGSAVLRRLQWGALVGTPVRTTHAPEICASSLLHPQRDNLDRWRKSRLGFTAGLIKTTTASVRYLTSLTTALPFATLLLTNTTLAQWPVVPTHPVSATIDFTYSGVDTTGIGGTSTGTGSFSFGVPSSTSSINLNNLSQFSFSQTTSVPVGTSSFSYTQADLTSFSLNFANLSLNTNAVGGTDSTFYPESFSVTANNAQTFNSFGQLLQSGSVTINRQSLTQAIAQGGLLVGTALYSGQPWITATFTPNFGLSLQQTAAIGGFSNFQWMQFLTTPSPSPFYTVSGQNVTGTNSDPPPGGYTYCTTKCNNYPFYYTNSELPQFEINGGRTLAFADRPLDTCLPGGNGVALTIRPCGRI